MDEVPRHRMERRPRRIATRGGSMSEEHEDRGPERPAGGLFRNLPWMILPLVPAAVLFVYFIEAGKIV